MDGVEATPFISNIGSPQGDAASGPLFTMYFEHFLRMFRDEMKKQPIDINDIAK